MTETAAPPAAALADLILARLLPAKSSVSPAKLRADVSALFKRPPAGEAFDATLADLRAAGLVAAKGQTLTADGRARALAYLGAADLPPKVNWGTVKAKYLVPKALGLSATSADDAKLVADGRKLAAVLLKRKYDLPVGTPTTLPGALEALACRELGFPELTTLAEVRRAALSRAMRTDRTLTAKEIEANAAAALLNPPRKGADGLRLLLLADFGATAPAAPRVEPPAVEPEPFDLEAFANTVRAAARTSPTGRFGDKVFVSHVWRQLEHDRPFAGLGMGGFKAKLVEANAAGLLALGRADLYQEHDPADLAASETAHLNATFHFVLTEAA